MHVSMFVNFLSHCLAFNLFVLKILAKRLPCKFELITFYVFCSYMPHCSSFSLHLRINSIGLVIKYSR